MADSIPTAPAAGCSSQSSCSKAGNEGSGCSGCASNRGEHDPMAMQDAQISQAVGHMGHVLFVMSGKGGVGKSSVAVNLAIALAERGKRVGILDVDIHGPSVPNLLGLGSGLDMDEDTEMLLPAIYRDNVKVLSMDSLLHDKDTAIIWRGPKKTAAIRQFLSDVKWGDLDFLVIDSPPGTGDEHLTIMKTLPDALSIMVTTPQEISLADVRKAMNFLQHAQGTVLGVVENMSGLACPHCGGDIPLFKKGGGEKLAEHYGVPFLGAIPLDPATVVAADKGVPVVLLEGEHAAKTQFFALADTVIESCANERFVRMHLPESQNTL